MMAWLVLGVGSIVAIVFLSLAVWSGQDFEVAQKWLEGED